MNTINVDIKLMSCGVQNIPVINKKTPALNVAVTMEELTCIFGFAQFMVYVAGTNKRITGENVAKIFRDSIGIDTDKTTTVMKCALISKTNYGVLKIKSVIAKSTYPATGHIIMELSDGTTRSDTVKSLKIEDAKVTILTDGGDFIYNKDDSQEHASDEDHLFYKWSLSKTPTTCNGFISMPSNYINAIGIEFSDK